MAGEALPLRLIAGQRAGGQIPLTQDDMAAILDVPRQTRRTRTSWTTESC